MRGEILSYDSTTGAGLISGDDGVRYSFTSDALKSPAVPAAGVRVDFVPEGEIATQILILAGGPTSTGVAGVAPIPAGTGFDFVSALLHFNGRLRRSHFWIGFLIIFAVSVVFFWVPFLGGLILLALIWPNLAISVKRLHDMGRTGWLLLVPFGVNIVVSIISFATMVSSFISSGGAPEFYEDNPAAALALVGPTFALSGVAFLISIAFLLWIGLTDSQKGENRFGPNPKGE